MSFDLLDDRTHKPLEFPYFPTVLQAVVWRNWGTVPVARIAQTLETTEENILELARDMGLHTPPDIEEHWLMRGYVTIIRNNWHLLPYKQLLTLLGWSAEKLAFMLKEDDFLYVKLGFFKPNTPLVTYRPLNEEQKLLTTKMKGLVRRHFLEINEKPAAAPFDFLKKFQNVRIPERRTIAPPLPDHIFVNEDWHLSYPDSLPHTAAFARRFTAAYEKKWGIKLSASAVPAEKNNLSLCIRPEPALLSESHKIEISSDNISITAVDETGLLRGLQRLELMMDNSGGPFLKKISAKYTTEFDLRLVYSYFAVYGDPLMEEENDPYPDALLLRLSELGINGIWLQGLLYNLVPSDDGTEISEGWEKRLDTLKKLVKRAAEYGIGVYLYLNEPRAMPERYFEKHPEWKGVASDGLTTLCTSMEGVKDYLRSSVAKLFREVPGLAGLFTITMSENLTNCYSHSFGGKTDCPRCSQRSQAEVVAEVNRVIAEGAHSVKPDARIIVWTWGWQPQWTRDAIKLLSPGISLMCTSEEGIPTDIAGIRGEVLDYSMSIIGPGERALGNWKAAAGEGLGTAAKVQINNTWQCSAVPYIPVLNSVERHLKNLKTAGVTGLMLSWTLGGWPSVNLELALRTYWKEEGSPENTLEMLAEQMYGKAAAHDVLHAWKAFDEAFKEFPFHIGVLYMAPQNCGPMNLLHEKPTGYKATMVCYPYDDLEAWRGIYPEDIFQEQFRRLSEGWKCGIDMLHKAAAKIPQENLNAFDDLRNVAGAAYCHFRSTYLQIRYIRLRNSLLQKNPDMGMDTDKVKTVEEIIHILNEEMDLAKTLHHIIRRDSRIGYEASNHYAYTQQDLMEKVVNCEYLKEIYSRKAALCE